MMTDSALCDKIKEILFSTKMVDEIDQLRPNDTYAVNVSTPEFLDLFLEDSARFSEQFRNAVLRILQQRFTGFDVKSTFKKLKIELRSSDNYITKMHDIDSTFENRTVIFDAVIIAADIPKTYVVSGTAMCDRCGSEQSVVSGFDRKVWMPSCANHSCRGGKMTLKPSNCVTNDIQTVLLQQPLEKAKNSSPVILTGKLIGQNVRTAFIGQNKRITGVFRTQFDSKTEEYHVNIDILSMSSLDMEEEILPSEVEQAELKTKSSKDDFIDTVVNSFAPDIYGYKDIKLSILLYLVGGVSVRKRGDINMLLVGDPSMAKSELLKFGKKLTQRSIYTSGRGTTGAGLTIGMVKLSDGRMVAQAGVLPLCSGGYAFIDEFDKMNKEDRASMHEAMEQQTVSIAKAGTVLTLPSKTSILAAANPKYGSYDSTMTLRDNIDVPAPLLSRFDMVWLIKDKVNVTEDMMKAQHILDTFDSEVNKDCFLDVEELSGYINLVKKLSPKLTDEVKSEFVKIYEKMRDLSQNEEMPIGVRQLEALARLSMAHAKLKFKDKVEIEDVHAVKDLLVSMYKGFDLDLSTGSRQIQLPSGKQTFEQKVIHIWNECKNSKGNVNVVIFFKKLEEAGIDDYKSKQIFGRWEKENMVKLNGDGTYKRLQ